MPFSNLTVVSVTGSEKYTQGAMWAVIRSCAELPNAKGLIISPNCPEFPTETYCQSEIKHQPCNPFGYLEYSLFMLYSLAQYIDTDYCLVVQNDGWVLNGKNWRDEFWHYDYIGAPVFSHYQTSTNMFGQWKAHLNYDNPTHADLFMQNGGFSLRSKRLLEMPRQLDIAVPLFAPELATGNKFEFNWSDKTHSEDIFLSVIIRPLLEQAGLKFAPFTVANQFSFESLAAPRFSNQAIENYLGHHFYKKIELVGFNKINVKFPKEWFPNNEIPENFYELFQNFTDLGYEIFIELI